MDADVTSTAAMAGKMARLEAELAEYRALGNRRRRTLLVALSVVSSVVALLAGMFLYSEVQTVDYLEQSLRTCQEAARPAR